MIKDAAPSAGPNGPALFLFKTDETKKKTNDKTKTQLKFNNPNQAPKAVNIFASPAPNSALPKKLITTTARTETK